jgi:hypothetical protein
MITRGEGGLLENRSDRSDQSDFQGGGCGEMDVGEEICVKLWRKVLTFGRVCVLVSAFFLGKEKTHQ